MSHFYWSKDVDEAVKLDFNWEQSMSADDVFFTNETETTAKASFTVNVNGKDQTGWRTLSTKEWQYLLNTRTMKNGKDRYTLNITYGGKMGLVLYPDDYDNDPISGSVETMPEGVVFLPAAGYRLGSSFDSVGVSGDYWSSTAGGSSLAYYVFFNSSNVFHDFSDYRYSGYCVRLITESE